MSDHATSDCEAVHGGFWQQDVNAWTSLTYVAAAAVVAAVALRSRARGPLLLLAALVAAEGVGSLIYHGRPSDGAQALHDVSLVGMLGFIAGWHVGRLGAGGLERPMRAATGAGLVALAAGVLAWLVGPSGVNALAGLGVVTVLVSELVARRRHLPPIWTPAPIALLIVAALAWFGGRSDSPFCLPDSWAQLHGLWHVLSALLVVTWVDRALEVGAADDAPRLWRRTIDRGLGLLAVVLARAFHRSIEVVGRERYPSRGPVLLVVNHANGFVDPIVVAAALGRLPRFLAKAALWKVVPARPLLGFAGVLPVHRSGDGDSATGNDATFAACYHELARGATVAIFPEGTTGDRGGLDRVRSGAARIAVGARAHAPDLLIVPVGLAFESRVATRTRCLVVIGEPIRPPEVPLQADDDAQRVAVHELTEDIREGMAAISPGYGSREERDLLRAAAAATLGPEPSFGAIELRARRLSAARADLRSRVIDCYRRYASEVHLLGLSEGEVSASRLPWRRLAGSALALAVVGPLLLTITLVHLPALVLVLAATRLVRSTATKGTVRMLVGLAAGLGTWLTVGFLLADGLRAVALAGLLGLGGALALATWSPLLAAGRSVAGRVRAHDRVSLMGALREARAMLTTEVEHALGEGQGPRG